MSEAMKAAGLKEGEAQLVESMTHEFYASSSCFMEHSLNILLTSFVFSLLPVPKLSHF